MADDSIIPVTIGLDVLKALIEMANPQTAQNIVMLRVSINAARAARMDAEDSTQINHYLEPKDKAYASA